MFANSASRHLRLAASAAALSLFGGSAVNAQPPADLDTLMIASMRSSGQEVATQAGRNPKSKTATQQAAAARNIAQKQIEPPVTAATVEMTAPQRGGLLEAIGVIGGTRSAPMEARSKSATVQSGPALFVTSGYGQAPQAEPLQEAAASDAVGLFAPARRATKSGASERFSGNAAPQPVAAPATSSAVPADASAPSGFNGFLASLGIGATAAPVPAVEASPDVPAIISASADGETRATKAEIKRAAKDKSKPELDHVASIGRPASGSQGRVRTQTLPVAKPFVVEHGAAKSTVAEKPFGDDNKAAPNIVVAEAMSTRTPAQIPVTRSVGLLDFLGVRGDTAPDPMEAKAQIPTTEIPVVQTPVAQIPVVYPDPAALNRDAMMARREISFAASDPDYRIDSGDKLRVVVYGQEGLTNTYAIDAGGGITMPLIGRVAARGLTPVGLAAHLTARLRKGFIREPSVAVEIEAYRPFFILGEVAAPGQYPYVPNMSVEAAVAIAGGFSPRARRDSVTLAHKADGGQSRAIVSLGTPLRPGDTITVGERWF